MITIIYKNKEYTIKLCKTGYLIERHPFSFGGGLEIVDDGEKITFENNVVFFFDPQEGKYYEEKYCNT